ncbi:MAG: hypothetical protein FJY83_10500 [Candidatus Aminicenantes bacterium]|nr:hypothetical protein [Candidatus Aminicenantes bacterium]
MPEVIFDCCVLSNFALADALPVLKASAGGTVRLTGFVSAEILRAIQGGHSRLAAITRGLSEGWIQEAHPSAPAEKKLFASLSQSLGLGEASSLAVAKARRWVFACDDRAARREATLLEVPLTGTIGILVKSVRNKSLKADQAERVLKRMIDEGFYSPVRSLKSLPD